MTRSGFSEVGGMKILRGHTHRLKDLAFSPDGRRLASSGADGTLRTWDTSTGEGTVLWRSGGRGENADGENVRRIHHKSAIR
jgi:WD40 repeat protein